MVPFIYYAEIEQQEGESLYLLDLLERKNTMNWNIPTLKGMAKNALTGSYWKSVLVGFLLMLCTATASSGTARGQNNLSRKRTSNYLNN